MLQSITSWCPTLDASLSSDSSRLKDHPCSWRIHTSICSRSASMVCSHSSRRKAFTFFSAIVVIVSYRLTLLFYLMRREVCRPPLAAADSEAQQQKSGVGADK